MGTYYLLLLCICGSMWIKIGCGYCSHGNHFPAVFPALLFMFIVLISFETLLIMHFQGLVMGRRKQFYF